jgi:hypothetical protein
MNATINHRCFFKTKKYNIFITVTNINKRKKHQLFTSGRIGSIDIKIGLLWRVTMEAIKIFLLK